MRGGGAHLHRTKSCIPGLPACLGLVCNVAPHFLEVQTSMLFVLQNCQLQRSGPTSTRKSLCSGRFGQHVAHLSANHWKHNIVCTNSSPHVTDTRHNATYRAYCVLKFSNFCHHISYDMGNSTEELYATDTYELPLEWATRNLTRRLACR